MNSRFVLAALLVLAPIMSKAANLELGLAQTHYSNAGDNIWYDQGYDHANDLRATGAILGASGAFNNRLGWRVWALDLGATSNWGTWPSDEDYFAHRSTPAVARGQGSGEAYGVTFAPVVSYRIAALTLQAEAGALVYTARWREQVQAIEGGPWSYYSQGWHTDYTPYMGFTAIYGHAFASYRKYRDVYAVDSVFGNSVKQYVLGYQWRF